MDLWRARIEARNAPGQLAEIAGALGRVGANIVSLDVHATGASRVADDLVVSADGTLDAPAFAALLAPLDATLLELRRADAHELVDPVTRALEAAGAVAGAARRREVLAVAIAQVLEVDVAYVRPVPDGLPVDGVAAQAVAEGRAVLGREHVKSFPAADGAWVLAVPAWLGGVLHVGVAVRRRPRFSFTETARLRAVLGVGEAVSRLPAGDAEVVVLADGGEVEVRALAPADERAVLRMHGRCGAETLHRRYFSGLRVVPPPLLRLLMDVDRPGRFAAVAAIGSEVVGLAHLDVPDDGTGEVAVMVEDAHQWRGIGSALLQRCVREASARGLTELTAVCLAENAAFPRLVARNGHPVTSTLDDGLRHLAFPVTDGRAGGARPLPAARGAGPPDDTRDGSDSLSHGR